MRDRVMSRRSLIITAGGGLAAAMLAACSRPDSPSLPITTKTKAIPGPITVGKRGDAIALIDGAGRVIWSVEQKSRSMIARSDYTSEILTIAQPPPMLVGESAYLGEQISLVRKSNTQIDWIGAGRNTGYVNFDPATGTAILFSQIVADNLGKDFLAHSPLHLINHQGRSTEISFSCGIAMAKVGAAAFALGAAIGTAGAQAGLDPVNDALVVAAAIAWNDAVAAEHEACQ